MNAAFSCTTNVKMSQEGRLDQFTVACHYNSINHVFKNVTVTEVKNRD